MRHTVQLYMTATQDKSGMSGFSMSTTSNLHESNSLLGLLVEEGNALLEAFLVGFPRLQQLSLPCAVCILDGSRHIHVLHPLIPSHHKQADYLCSLAQRPL